MRTTRSHRFGLMVIAAATAVGSCVGDSADVARRAVTQCAPQNAFSYAICVGDNMADVGQLWVGKGPSGPGSVGVNGNTAFVNRTEIQGDLVSYHDFHATTETTIAGN